MPVRRPVYLLNSVERLRWCARVQIAVSGSTAAGHCAVKLLAITIAISTKKKPNANDAFSGRLMDKRIERLQEEKIQ